MPKMYYLVVDDSISVCVLSYCLANSKEEAMDQFCIRGFVDGEVMLEEDYLCDYAYLLN